MRARLPLPPRSARHPRRHPRRLRLRHPPPTTANFNTAEYQRSVAAVAANADAVYQRGYSGKGIKIGVVDSGINPDLAEFAGKIDPASRDVYNRGSGISDEDGHGTAVSAVAMAAKNDQGMHGVAFNSTVVAIRSDSPGSCAKTGDDGGCKFPDSAISQGIDTARLAGAKVINLSLGGSAPSSGVMSAISRAVSAGIVVVISAGNDGRDATKGANPDGFSLVPAQTFPGQVIIAGSIGVANGTGGTNLDQISEFSNRAGSGASWYLTALGYRVIAPNHTGTLYYMSGTSFAAPAISGGIALLAEAFPHLTARQLIEILFRSADDLGAPGIDPIFGNGRMNLNRAFQPIGQTSLAGTSTPVDNPSDLPPAGGDGGGDKGGDSLGAIILDGYDRAFVMDFARTLRQAEPSKPLARALHGGVKVAGAAAGPLSIAMTVSERRDLPLGFAVEKLGIGPEDARKARLVAGSAIARLDNKSAAAFGFREGAKALERRLSGAEAGAFLIAKDISGDPGFSAQRDGSMALRRDLGPVGLTVASESGSVWSEVQTSATGSPYRWNSLSVDRNVGSTWLSASVSRLDEKRTLLGGRMGPVLGGDGSSSMFVDLEARRELGSGFSAALSARRGWTTFGGGKFQTGAYGADLTKSGVFGSDDRIGVRVSQPLRIESGGFSLMLPTAYDYDSGTATSSRVHRALVPSGREVDAEVSYSTRVLDGSGWLGGNLFVRRQPGHIASANNDYGAAIRFTLGF